MISEKISLLKTKISAACQRVGRRAQDIKIVGVSKSVGAEDIQQAVEAGIVNIGENKVQDALFKHKALESVTGHSVATIWHMVGHLQTNKVKEAVKIFDLIHSLDSLKLAYEIDKQAAKINKVQDILVEVNVAQEKTKFGLKPQEAIAVIKKISQLKNINIKGLMTIAPIVNDLEKARSFFRQLRQLRDKLNELRVTGYELRELSMGMTDDFEVAIEEGATMLRIGRAIFGRGLTQINKQ